jgi:hypothetical protein
MDDDDDDFDFEEFVRQQRKYKNIGSEEEEGAQPIDLRHLHLECNYRCRSSIIAKCIELYPESLSIADKKGYMPLHALLWNRRSSIQDALMMMETYPAALQHPNLLGYLPLHIECSNKCRSSVISKCIELYPESISMTNVKGYLPLHLMLWCEFSLADDVLMMIKKYPAALEHRNLEEDTAILIECRFHSRSIVISKCVELYPASLSMTDNWGHLPLHRLLCNEVNKLPSIDDALMLINKHRASLEHRNNSGQLPLHMECMCKGRLTILSKCIELYPEALAVTNEKEDLPLHCLLSNRASSIDAALMVIKKYSAALKHQNRKSQLPLLIECYNQCRPDVMSTCIELYPEALDDSIIQTIIRKVNRGNLHDYLSLLSNIFVARPMSLYHRYASVDNDIRKDLFCRRRILNLLPRNVFTPAHDTDHRDLNWQSRVAMMILLSQMKIQQSSKAS